MRAADIKYCALTARGENDVLAVDMAHLDQNYASRMRQSCRNAPNFRLHFGKAAAVEAWNATPKLKHHMLSDDDASMQ